MIVPAPSWTPTAHEYHAQTGVWSSTRLKAFRESPALAFQGFRRPGLPPEALVVGSAINAYVLAESLHAPGGPLGRDLHVLDVKNRRSPAYGQAVRAWGSSRLVLTKHEDDLARAAADSILEARTPAAELARSLLTREGYAEWAWQWDEPVGDWDACAAPADGGPPGCRLRSLGDVWERQRTIPCQAMLDQVTEVAGEVAYVELKSTLDPSPKAFTKQAWNLGYHCQAAFNVRAVRHALGDQPEEISVYHVAVRNKDPHEVAVYRMSDDLISRGNRQIEIDLHVLAQRLDDETGASWCHPWEALTDDVIPTLDAPPWA